jgi:hypothetical protein
VSTRPSRSSSASETTGRSVEQSRVVELPFVGDDVRVRASGGYEVVVADELSNPRPRHANQMQQRDAAVAEIVRREARDAGSGAGARGLRAIR